MLSISSNALSKWLSFFLPLRTRFRRLLGSLLARAASCRLTCSAARADCVLGVQSPRVARTPSSPISFAGCWSSSPIAVGGSTALTPHRHATPHRDSRPQQQEPPRPATPRRQATPHRDSRSQQQEPPRPATPRRQATPHCARGASTSGGSSERHVFVDNSNILNALDRSVRISPTALARLLQANGFAVVVGRTRAEGVLTATVGSGSSGSRPDFGPRSVLVMQTTVRISSMTSCRTRSTERYCTALRRHWCLRRGTASLTAAGEPSPRQCGMQRNGVGRSRCGRGGAVCLGRFGSWPRSTQQA
jgi:hypothetical protein